MTLPEFFEDLSKELFKLKLPEPAPFEDKLRPGAIQSHLTMLSENWSNPFAASMCKSSWDYVKKWMPKEVWEKYTGDEGLKADLKEWLKSL